MPNEKQEGQDVKDGTSNTPDKTEPKQETTPDTTKDTKKQEGGEQEKGNDELKALKDEAIQRRKENKALKEKLERQERALAILQGKEKPDLDPVEQAKAAQESKLRNALLRAELASVARDAHDPSVLMALDAKLFKDVTVDLDNETVDREELEASVNKLRQTRPYLFKSAELPKDKDKTAPLPKDGGQPTNGKNHMAIWKQLKDQGRTAEAAGYYQKNRAEIMAQMNQNQKTS